MIDDHTLREFLAESLPPTEMARVEKAIRDSAELRDRLEQVRHDRAEPGLHSLGAIWSRNRLTCIGREEMGSYLLDVLEPERASYIKFHIEVLECPFCRANLADLKAKSQPATTFDHERRRRIFHSSRGLLSSGE